MNPKTPLYVKNLPCGHLKRKPSEISSKRNQLEGNKKHVDSKEATPHSLLEIILVHDFQDPSEMFDFGDVWMWWLEIRGSTSWWSKICHDRFFLFFFAGDDAISQNQKRQFGQLFLTIWRHIIVRKWVAHERPPVSHEGGLSKVVFILF